MVDLITPVIVATFGMGMLVVIFGFYLLKTNGQERTRYESSDYYQQYSNRSRYKSRTGASTSNYGGTFRRDEDLEAAEREDRMRRNATARQMLIVLVILSIIIVAVTTVFFPEGALGLFFLILFIPLLLQLFRFRRQQGARERNPDDERR